MDSFIDTLKQYGINIEKTEKNRDLLMCAFTHRSFKQKNPKVTDNERLEFIGDKVLNLIIADFLYEKYYDKDPGFLTNLYGRLVNNKTLAQLTDEPGFIQYLRYSNDQPNVPYTENVKADLFEAILGALYKMVPLSNINDFVLSIFKNFGQDNMNSNNNYKSQLQTYFQRYIMGTLPIYEITNSSYDPDTNTNIFVYVIKDYTGKIYGEGSGKNKKMAQMEAAKNVLKKLNI